MTMHARIFFKTIFFLSLVIFLTHCGSNDNPTTVASRTLSDLLETDQATWENALADPFALGTGDESAQFNDATLSTIEGEEGTYTDATTLAKPNMIMTDGILPTTGIACKPYLIRLRWGQFPYNDTIATTTDWSGSVSVNRGTLILKRPIAFDLGDSVATRTDRTVISFTSRTKRHFDGLAIKYFECQKDGTIAATNTNRTTLTFTSPVFTKSYDLAQLTGTSTATTTGTSTTGVIITEENVDTLGNKFQIQSIQLSNISNLCQGVMHGRWHKLPNRSGGLFRGIVQAGENFRRVGHVMGVYGTNKNTEKVWSAKLISHKGGFVGIMKGSSIGTSTGTFSGKIFNRDKKEIGMVSGNYVEGEDKTKFGTWSSDFTLQCKDAAVTALNTDSTQEIDIAQQIEPTS